MPRVFVWERPCRVEFSSENQKTLAQGLTIDIQFLVESLAWELSFVNCLGTVVLDFLF